MQEFEREFPAQWRISAAVALLLVAGGVVFVALSDPGSNAPATPTCPDGTPSGPPVRPPDAFFVETEAHPEYAGTYVLSDCFALVVLTTGDKATIQEIASRHFTPNERFIVARATYTHAELEELAERVIDDREKWLAEGIDIQTVGVDVERNRTMVGILELNDEAREQLDDRYGDRIVVVQSGPYYPLPGTN